MSLIYSIHFAILVPVSTLISVANKMYCRVGMQASNHFFLLMHLATLRSS